MSQRDASNELIERALRRLVEKNLTTTAVVITGDERRGYWVRFRNSGRRLVCEAVHNRCLEPAHRLGPAQINALKVLGWKEPEGEDGNYVRVFEPDEGDDYERIALLLRQLFSDVYGLPPQPDLSLKLVDELRGERDPEQPSDTRGLWVQYWLADVRSGEAYVEWEPEPLPSELRASQLPSYLAQRFGTALEPWNGNQDDVVFPAPDDLVRRPAALIVMPMVLDESYAFPQPLALRIRQLRRAFSDGSRDARRKFALDEPWDGPLLVPEELEQPVNDFAARACRAWLIGRSLVDLTRPLREKEANPIPCPGLTEISASLESAVRATHAEAEEAVALCRTLAAPPAEDSKPDDPSAAKPTREYERELMHHYLAAGVASYRAEKSARSLAQLAYGLIARGETDPSVYLLERAAVAACTPPEDQGPRASVLQDGVRFRSKTPDELAVEVAGLISRLLVERDARVRLSVERGGPAVVIDVDSEDRLLVSVKGPLTRGLKAALANTGWTKRNASGQPIGKRWRSPVTVMTPTNVIVRTLFDALELAEPRRLRVRIEASTAAREKELASHETPAAE